MLTYGRFNLHIRAKTPHKSQFNVLLVISHYIACVFYVWDVMCENSLIFWYHFGRNRYFDPFRTVKYYPFSTPYYIENPLFGNYIVSGDTAETTYGSCRN